MLGEAAMGIEIGRLLTMRAAFRLEQGGMARAEVSMAKIQVADALHRAVDTAIQLLGASGYSKDTPLEWMYRYARQARLVDGASEVHRMVVARELLRDSGGFFAMELNAEAVGRLASWLAAALGARSVRVLGMRAARRRRDPGELALESRDRGGPRAGRHALVLRTDAPSGVAGELGPRAGVSHPRGGPRAPASPCPSPGAGATTPACSAAAST